MSSASFKYADVGIKPAGTLSETATMLGNVLGGLRFELDSNGTFDEYPAYIAQQGGVRYALLGIPAPEYDIREDRDENFSLQVQSVDADACGPKEDITDALVAAIRNDGHLECWRLK